MKKNLTEQDYQKGEGHIIPLFVKIIWPIFFIWTLFFFFSYVLPDLKFWLLK